MTNSKSKLWSVPGLFLLAVLLVAVVAISNKLFKGFRLDLTENNLYTMTDGTKAILKSIDEPINLYFYFSDTTSKQLSGLRSYAQRVQETLEEYALRSGGKLTLHVIDPLPFSEQEDEAAQSGLQAVPITTAGDSLYFGLVGTNSLDDQVVIPFFQPEKESFLEYDISKLVYSLSTPKKIVIGLMSTLPVAGGVDPNTGQPQQPWVIYTQIDQFFDFKTLAPTATSIGDDIDVLMLVHPKELSEDTEFAIEQFMLAGGKALIFVDPYADADRPVIDQNNPASMFQSRGSNLPKLFSQWGLIFSSGQFIADQSLALNVSNPNGMGQLRNYGLLGITPETINQEDVVSADLGSVNVGFAGSLSLADGAAVSMEPLLSSTSDSGLQDAQNLLFSQDPKQIQGNFSADGQTYVIAARVSGNVQSAFADRIEATDSESLNGQSKFKSEGVINAIILADADLLSNPFWVSVRNFFGQQISDAFASNGDLVFNSLDNLTGSSDLISIRGRETYRRPFKMVEQLKREADEQFRQTEERLQQELTLTEQRLNELQTNRSDQGAMIVTPEQKIEIDNFLEQKARIRKDLREVRRNLDKDIKSLGAWLKAINIILVPLVLTVIVLFRSGRRRGQSL